jgi:RNA-binding protein
VELTGKQRRFLRGLGHSLHALVQLGKGGIDEGVLRALDAALEQHELVKVRLGAEAPEGRDEAAEALAERTRSAVAQVLGRTILLYRRHPKEPKIVLPRALPAAPDDQK